MASTYSPSLRIELIGAGEQAGTWNTTTNTNLGTLIEDAIAGYVSVSVTSANQAFTALDGAPDQARNAVIALTTTTTAAFAVYAPPQEKTYVIYNTTAYTATVYNSTVLGNTTAAGTGVAVAAGGKVAVFSDGTNFRTTDAASFSGVLPIVNGGTGTTSTTFCNLTTNVTGNLPVARLNSGTSASASTFWRGDGQWVAPTVVSPGGSTTQVQYNSSGSFAGSANLTFDGTNLTCAGNVTAYSDEALKMNWRGFPEDFIEQLAQIQSGIFDRIDSGMTQVGVGAGSLKKVMPNAVQDNENGLMSVAYGNAALAAVIELAKRVVSLEKQIKDKS